MEAKRFKKKKSKESTKKSRSRTLCNLDDPVEMALWVKVARSSLKIGIDDHG